MSFERKINLFYQFSLLCLVEYTGTCLTLDGCTTCSCPDWRSRLFHICIHIINHFVIIFGIVCFDLELYSTLTYPIYTQVYFPILVMCVISFQIGLIQSFGQQMVAPYACLNTSALSSKKILMYFSIIYLWQVSWFVKKIYSKNKQPMATNSIMPLRFITYCFLWPSRLGSKFLSGDKEYCFKTNRHCIHVLNGLYIITERCRDTINVPYDSSFSDVSHFELLNCEGACVSTFWSCYWNLNEVKCFVTV